MKTLNEILNEKPALKPITKNFYFISTLFFVLFIFIMHAFGPMRPTGQIEYARSFLQVLRINLELLHRSFSHLGTQHALLNMLCFFVVGLYLERKMGSLRLFLSVIGIAIITAWASMIWSRNWVGFSLVNFAFYAIVIVDYVFVVLNKKRTKQQVIFGGVVVALIYWAMCFSGGTTAFTFEWYPYDLLNHGGHAVGFLAGFMLCLAYNIAELFFVMKISNRK